MEPLHGVCPILRCNSIRNHPFASHKMWRDIVEALLTFSFKLKPFVIFIGRRNLKVTPSNQKTSYYTGVPLAPPGVRGRPPPLVVLVYPQLKPYPEKRVSIFGYLGTVVDTRRSSSKVSIISH